MKTENITIVGLGRTGVSVGLALQKADLGITIAGHDEDRGAIKAAQEAGAIDDGQPNLSRAAAAADILILAVPVPAVERVFQLIGDQVREHVLVLDLSGLKGPSQALAQKYLARGHFVGAAPVLAADALREGTAATAPARADLFENSVFCLMPAPQADPQAVETAVNVGAILGAQPFFLDPAEYDSLMQGVQTVPGLLAAALFRAVTQAQGWRDMLRFAGAPFAQATAALDDGEEVAHLALHDQPATLRWLDALLAQLQEMREWVAEGDTERLSALLQKLAQEREKWMYERAENDWQEITTPDVAPFSIREQMLGRWGRQRD
jgi:prephenate dehydrogenase